MLHGAGLRTTLTERRREATAAILAKGTRTASIQRGLPSSPFSRPSRSASSWPAAFSPSQIPLAHRRSRGFSLPPSSSALEARALFPARQLNWERERGGWFNVAKGAGQRVTGKSRESLVLSKATDGEMNFPPPTYTTFGYLPHHIVHKLLPVENCRVRLTMQQSSSQLLATAKLLSGRTCLPKYSPASAVGTAISKSAKCCSSNDLRRAAQQCNQGFSTKIVLGIETSCDDTGAAVVDEMGNVLGEALHSQGEVHLKTGGIIPPVAQQLHQENIARIVEQALSDSGVGVDDLSAVATTVKPGLALSLGVGLSYSLKLVERHQKPFIPIHHMEAHALTIRATDRVEFPFLVLLVSGGHCLLAVARGVSDFLLLGQSVDIAPGDMLDKVARRLSLQQHLECSGLNGGKAIENLAQRGNKLRYGFKVPMERLLNCSFSFSGLQSMVDRAITQKEKEEGLQQGQLLSCVSDLASAVQHTVAVHIARRTHRGILFCMQKGILPQNDATLVVSGGVASNQYIRKTLQIVTDATGFSLLCPPPRLCTDNGVMIAWNGIERLRAGLGILHSTEGIRYEPKAPLGTDISEQVEKAAIKVPELNLT
ncbi:tRNA N6-adenosine threonylcarbamoyltransferase, mitochondrial [Heteronotia binoei]|uniref:tRNA N6-adenosine threonylcarbamoyltransferase, mitochondrial n=1 Tax=Heteronotia binoei TaxID=13085 RepID=UPI00293058D8|nr:tRNA N6-adenosine threonylcarbamoyltransferase, mitochondrial [Heteronotia binoei]